MTIFKPDFYEVNLSKAECDTLENCRILLCEIENQMRRNSCDEIVMMSFEEEKHLSITDLQVINYQLQDLKNSIRIE